MILPKPARVLVNPETALLDLDPEQAKRHRGTPEHAARTENIRLHGILEPLTGRKRPNGRYTVLSGNGRALSAIELKLETVPMLLLSEGDTNDAVCIVVANLLRKDLTPGQLLEGVESIRASQPDWMNKDIAAQIGMAEGRVSQLFAIGACPFARAELAEGRMSVNEAYAVAKAAIETKAGLIALKAAGAPSQSIIAAAKPKPEEPAAQEKPSKSKRVSMRLKAGASVSVTADVASVDGLIAVLTEALELARKSLRENHSLATATRAWADKAKAGA